MLTQKYQLEGVNNDNCPTRLLLSRLEGKWKILLLYHLFNGEKRPGELERLVPEASRQVLTAQLKELERDGIIHRTVFAEVPPRVEYTLTAFGRSREPLLDLLFDRGQAYARQIEGNQPVTQPNCGKTGTALSKQLV